MAKEWRVLLQRFLFVKDAPPKISEKRWIIVDNKCLPVALDFFTLSWKNVRRGFVPKF